MELEEIRNYCCKKSDVIECFPFDESTLVFKTNNKMFCLVSIIETKFINLKCEPKKALELREIYSDEILPGYHMNKQHWNSVMINGKLPSKLIFELIDHSYDLLKKS